MPTSAGWPLEQHFWAWHGWSWNWDVCRFDRSHGGPQVLKVDDNNVFRHAHRCLSHFPFRAKHRCRHNTTACSIVKPMLVRNYTVSLQHTLRYLRMHFCWFSMMVFVIVFPALILMICRMIATGFLISCTFYHFHILYVFLLVCVIKKNWFCQVSLVLRLLLRLLRMVSLKVKREYFSTSSVVKGCPSLTLPEGGSLKLLWICHSSWCL
jgi:hypothetical protein